MADVRDLQHAYKGERTLIKNASGEFCTACGEGFLGVIEAERISKAMRAFNRRVDASYIEPATLVAFREGMGLDLAGAAERLGCSADELAAYESGKARAPLWVVRVMETVVGKGQGRK